MGREGTTRREVLRKTAYVVPAVLTLAATPSLAAKGSADAKDPKDKPPKG
jgi:hypothetical protein